MRGKIFSGFLILLFFICLMVPFLQAQDFQSLYSAGRYQEALDIISHRLSDIYQKRNEDRQVPSAVRNIFSEQDEASGKDPMKIYRIRKAGGLFIEENPELFSLHKSAAECCEKLGLYREAVSSVCQAFRYHMPKQGTDDVLYYMLAGIYGKTGEKQARISALEAAFSMNPENYSCSLELGRELSDTPEKKKALYHIRRYMDSTENFSPDLYLLAAGLNEDLGYFLETEKMYIRYLEKNPSDGSIHFALGYTAFARTGNHSLALKEFAASMEYVPESDVFRHSRAWEYTGDIYFSDLNFRKALEAYEKASVFQDRVRQMADDLSDRINTLSGQISELKTGIISRQDYSRFREYEDLENQRGKAGLELSVISRKYRDLNCGAVRWNMAQCCERMEDYEAAVKYYDQARAFDFRSSEARENIIKLQLKIKRGY